METVTISSKFQVVIPRRVRKSMRLNPGQKMQVVEYRNTIEFVPIRLMARLRGFVRGIDVTVDREADRL